MAAVLSSTGLAVFLSGISVITGAPLAGIAGLLGFISTTMTIGSKKLNKKITKQEKTISLAEAKHLLINKLISKAFNDGSGSDVEFDLIIHEVEQYKMMKKGLRSKAIPSFEVIYAKALKEEIKKEYPKKLGSLINLKS